MRLLPLALLPAAGVATTVSYTSGSYTYQMRMVGASGAVLDGSVEASGRLEVKRSDSSVWGTVCDDHWASHPANAELVCGALFGTVALSYDDDLAANGFAAVSSAKPVYVDDLDCVGGEASVFACDASAWGVNDCSHYEDVHLTCAAPDDDNLTPTPAPTPKPTQSCARTVRVGTFDEANPYALAPVTAWLDDADACWVFYRETSGGRTIGHLEAGDSVGINH